MGKTELVTAVRQRTGESNDTVNKIITESLNEIMDAVSKGDTVTLPGFGTFKMKLRAAREGRNPQTGEAMNIPEKKAVKFTAGNSFKNIVNK